MKFQQQHLNTCLWVPKKCCNSTNNNQYGAYLRNTFLENLFVLVLGNLPAIEVWPNGIFHLLYDTFLEILKQKSISLISRKLHGPHMQDCKENAGERAFIRNEGKNENEIMKKITFSLPPQPHKNKQIKIFKKRKQSDYTKHTNK